MERKIKEKVEMRNRNFERWNNQTARGNNKHFYYLVEDKSVGVLACRRKGCVLNTQPGKWPEKITSIRCLTNKCSGEALEGETGRKKIEKDFVPEALLI